ncbi:uncharacterized protein FTOL_07594 [Fusarium torulosum]|uniref:Uncharacterized protein n=1 Tax=Fusarium torulosum TaxID=33205 RepID=A0AAE8MC32_9HYPO|nr:uncharacterized protein FTOL_07594 [Fusarium torulosum]
MRPGGAPAWERSLDPNQLGHRSNWPLIEDQPLAVAPESLEDDAYLNSQHARCPDTESNKENQKRYQTHSYQNSLDDIPDRPLFERRPRRKTRPDRYTSKNQTTKEKSHIEGETEKRKRKTRPKKRHLRSSRDVMNNFVSGAIPNTRVTMRPSLTAGLFLNGRSSTAGQVTDLTFNDMPVMKLRGSSGNEKEELQLSTPTQSDHDEDETLYDGRSLQQHAEPSTASIKNKKENKQKIANKNLDTVPQDFSLEDIHGIQDHLISSGEFAQTSDSESPEVTLKRLIETGVFDGTSMLNKTANQIIQPKSANGSNLGPGWNSNIPQYQDKGVLADPDMGTLTNSSPQIPPNIDQNDSRHVVASTNTAERGNQENEVPVYTHSATQVDSPTLTKVSTRNDIHERGAEQHVVVETEKKTDPVAHSRWHSVSRTSEEGHHYIQCLDRKGLPGPLIQSIGTHPADDQHLFHQDVAQNSEVQHPEQSLHHRYKSHDERTSPLHGLSYQHPCQSLYGICNIPSDSPSILPTAYSDMYTIQGEAHGGNTQLARPYYNHDDETMQQFIERIEGEAGSRWDEPHEVFDGSFIDGIDNFAETEFKRAQDGSDTFPRGDLGYGEITRPASHNVYPDLYCDPTIERPQYESVYWRNSDNGQDYHFAGRADRRFDSPEPEMLAFWRPNRF